MLKRIAASITIIFALLSCSSPGRSLHEELQAYVDSTGADVGVALISEGDTLLINNGKHYQLNSVMKLFQAVAAANAMSRNGWTLDSLIEVTAEELRPETYSPMRDEMLSKCPFRIPVADLLRYSLQRSDNNASDVISNRIISLSAAEIFLKTLQLGDFQIRWTEDEMHQSPERSNDNWTTPIAAASLIHRLYNDTIIPLAYRDFLTSTLDSCQTGADRLPRPLQGTAAVIGHKTGTGFSDAQGRPQGVNDVGFIRLPNGRRYSLAVFVNTNPGGLDSEQIIGDISEIVYLYLNQQQ